MQENQFNYDPVDGTQIPKGMEYAKKDGVYFASLQTQQMFYTLIEKGFTVKFANGKPSLVQQQGATFWTLMQNGRVGGYFRHKTDGKRVVTNLLTGEYVFKVEVPELFNAKSKRGLSKSIMVSLEVISGTGNEKIIAFQTVLNKSKPMLESKFTVLSWQTGATVLLDFKTSTFFSKIHVKSEIMFYSLPKIKEETIVERKATKALVQPDEFCIELKKDANGVGMTLGWDKELKCVIVKDIDDKGVAARIDKLTPGCRIFGINGVRIEGKNFKEVIKLLRSVPRTVFLIMKPMIEGYSIAPTLHKVKNIADFHTGTPKKQPVLEQMEQPAEATKPKKKIPPPPPRRLHRTISSTSSQAKKKPALPLRSKASIRKASPPPPPPSTTQKIKTEKTISAQNHKEFVKYFSLRKAKLPEGAIFNAWVRDGCIEPVPEGFFTTTWQISVLEQLMKKHKNNPQKVASLKTKTEAIKNCKNLPSPPPKARTDVKEPARTETTPIPLGKFEKYMKMKAAKLPEGAIFNAWKRDGMPGTAPDGFWSPVWLTEVNKIKNPGMVIQQEKKEVKTVQQRPTRPNNHLEELKKFDRSVLAKNTKDSTKVVKKSNLPPSNPMEELKMFDRSMLKSTKDIEAKKPVAKSSSGNSHLDALKNFDRSTLKQSSKRERKPPIKTEPTPPTNPLEELKMFHRSMLKPTKIGKAATKVQPNVTNSHIDELKKLNRNVLKSSTPAKEIEDIDIANSNSSQDEPTESKEQVAANNRFDAVITFDKSKLKPIKPATNSALGMNLQEAFSTALDSIREAVGGYESGEDSWDDDDDWVM